MTFADKLAAIRADAAATPLGQALAALGFTIEPMGGNCTAWRRELAAGAYVLVSDCDGGSHEPDADGTMTLGVYDAESEEIGESSTVRVDDMANALDIALGAIFARQLKTEVTAEAFAAIQSQNGAEPGAPWCASHNYCDANMTMHAAWLAFFGRDILPAEGEPTDSDFEAWNRAWSDARARFLSA